MENNQNMNFNFDVGSNWDQQKVKLQAEYSQLTDADLRCTAGQENELLMRVQRKLNKNQEDVIRILNQVKEETSIDQTNANQSVFNPGSIDDSDFTEHDLIRNTTNQENNYQSNATDLNEDEDDEEMGRAI